MASPLISTCKSLICRILNPLKGSGAEGCLMRLCLIWNTAQIQIRHNLIRHPSAPEPFRGFRILQISDLHVDMSGLAIQRLTEILPEISYDVCVLTGDYR